jgi:YidC/Oxa1 family membrane protein insertase
MKQDSLRNIIGMTLIFAIFFFWTRMNAPKPAQIAAEKRVKDSLENLQKTPISSVASAPNMPSPAPSATISPKDSNALKQLGGTFGAFAASAVGEEKTETIENDLFKITFTNKGGIIKEVELKKYLKSYDDAQGKELKTALKLLNDSKNRFEYLLPVAGLNTMVSTQSLFFTPSKNGNTVTYRANAGNGKFFEQTYSIQDGTYNINYDVKMEGLNTVLQNGRNSIDLNWVNYLDKIEKNSDYERNYTSVYFKPDEKNPDYCKCTANDKTDAAGKTIKWVSHSNQFFNTSLIAAGTSFPGATLETEMLDEKSPSLKRLASQIKIPYNPNGTSETFRMNMYVGPNEFDRLRAYGEYVEDIIPFGSNILGTINRWVIRPMFNFLSNFVGSKGIVILMLTLLVKALLYPLSYKMLYTQAKQEALKPELEKIKAKLGDDQQAYQMESMKMYREHGVNPLGGCMPMVLQMPIWFALYRFFPAAIEFRQAPFLWATDLSSYDVAFMLPFNIPTLGNHISLFSILWLVTTLIYTFYSTKSMDFSANPAMKPLQYIMPIMFFAAFNKFASGLTAYLVFSNVLNIGQTLITKNYIINKDKIKAEMSEFKKKPKSKGIFATKMEEAMKMQEQMKRK